MNLHLDTLLNFPNATVEACSHIEDSCHLKIRWLNDGINCPICGAFTDDLHQTKRPLIRDLPVFGRSTYLEVPHRQFYCPHCQRFFYESFNFIDFRRHQTCRYQQHVFERVSATTILQVSREEGLSEGQVRSIFEHLSEPKKKSYWGEPTRISIDEISLRKGHQQFVTVICDIDRGDLIEVIDSHKQDEIIEALSQLSLETREKVEEVSLDMWGGYTKVVEEIFPNAQIVYDRFHIMKNVNEELNKIRLAAGINDKGSRGLLLSNREDIEQDEKRKEKLVKILSQSPTLAIAYEFKEELRTIFETSKTLNQGKHRLEKWLRHAQQIYHQASNMIRSHLSGICNYFINRTTSGVMEGINNRIKLIKRQGYGFTNFESFRSRLLACFSDK